MIFFLFLLSTDGPFSKFEDHAPDFQGVSSRGINDIERCLIDMPGKIGAPHVYRQPDRPKAVRFLWIDKARSIRRIDLEEIDGKTKVIAWHPRKLAAECAGL